MFLGAEAHDVVPYGGFLWRADGNSKDASKDAPKDVVSGAAWVHQMK
jgi:hypothetical protein